MNALLNLINHDPDIDKTYLYDKDPCEPKYRLLIIKRILKSCGCYLQKYEEYNPNKKRKILVVFDDIIADMLRDKKPNPIVTESFIRGRKRNIFYFAVPKNIRLNSTHYFAMKIPNKESFNKSHLIIHQILTFKTS